MTVRALIFGDVGTITETDELHRQSYNSSFAAAGLDWHWSREDYAPMLSRTGTRQFLAARAESLGQQIDVDALQRAKDAAFDRALEQGGLKLRPGVMGLVAAAQSAGLMIGFVPGTDAATLDRILGAAGHRLRPDDFDQITYLYDVFPGKPEPAPYVQTLRLLGVRAADAVAIENCPETALASVGAGLRTFGYPTEVRRAALFPPRVVVVSGLRPEILHLTRGAAA